MLEQLKGIPHFEKATVRQLAGQYGLTPKTVDTYISRFLKRREIVLLKRGVYVTTDFLNQHHDDVSYTFYLANILRNPSYVSSWTALQYYNLATEAVNTITSVTTKVTRTYSTKAGSFKYQSINKDLFADFALKRGGFDFFIASPSKALFDMLYFKTHQFRGVEKKEIDRIVEAARVDWDDMDPREKKKFYSMINTYFNG